MNFGDWQAQQKAQKDEERKRKTQAAEALKNYRGGGLLSEEETKLTALREEERKQKIEAERQLREYRGTMSEEDARKAAEKDAELRKKKAAEEELRALAANGDNDNSQQQQGDVFIEGAVSSKAQLFSNEMENEEMPVTSSPRKSKIAPATVAPETNGEASQQQQPVESPQTAPAVVVVNMEVLFVFGLISEDASPSIDEYLLAIDRLIKGQFEGQLRPFEKLSFPVVCKNEVDAMYTDPAGRTSVQRRLITISVAFTAVDAERGVTMRMKIVSDIRLAIQNEALKKMSL